jgi:hypothetical protein
MLYNTEIKYFICTTMTHKIENSKASNLLLLMGFFALKFIKFTDSSWLQEQTYFD